MRPQVRAFRNTAVQVCQLRGFSFSEFMDDWGLEEILDDADNGDWPAQEIAAQALTRCCLTNGTFNNFQVGLLTVITFLRDQLPPLGQGEQQAFADLVAILKTAGNLQSIRAWMSSHFP
jgi:hypothetical protein